MSPQPASEPRTSRHTRPALEGEEVHIGEWLADLWDGRYLILASILLCAAAGGFLIWRTTPRYEATSLLQLHEKKAANSDPAFAKMEGLFSEPSDALAEVEILKSDLILGRAVKALNLDIYAQPRLKPLIGAALARRMATPPRLEVDLLQIPERLVAKVFHVKPLADGSFQWSSPAGAPLATGRPGETLSAVLEGEVIKLRVRALAGRPGQDFQVFRKPLPAAVGDLRKGFEAAERGKLTNVIGLSYKDISPTRAADVLNAIVNQYIQYKLEKKTGEADKTRVLLEAKMGPLKAELDASEQRLNQFRSRFGSVDLSREAENLLLQSSNFATQITALEQKKQEALRTYRENSDVVTTINQQIAQLKEEAGQVSGRVRALPGTQQEVVRLSRDVQVNTELYTALLNNIQQLQMATLGDVGSVAVVDPATADPDPVGAKPSMLMAFYLFLGAFLGAGLTVFRQLLRRGVKDHRLIESRLGLPVLVTIPHSRDQERHAAAIGKSREGAHLLALANPDDLAIESLRSLRTSLLFSLKDAPNRTIMVTGPSPSVGKSFLCSNLAVMLAQTGEKVLLVDADLRRGNLHRYFGLKSRLGGLSDALAGRSEWRTVVHPTEFPDLHLMSTGLIPADSAQLLLSPRFRAFVAEAQAEYTYVLLDVPPLLPVTDATLVGPSAGTILLVAKYAQHSLDELRACMQRLDDHGLSIHGCVFNDIVATGLGYGYQDYRYAYHYKYR